MSSHATMTLKSFKDRVRKIKSFEEALGLMYWDLRTGAPKKGVTTRSETIGMLSSEMFSLSVSDEMGDEIALLSEAIHFEKLNRIDQKLILETKKEFDRNKKIPPKLYEEYVVLTSIAESVWEEAKQESDFEKLQPYLEKIVNFNLEFIDLWGYKADKYDTLLDSYEPELTVAQLDPMFAALRTHLVPLVEAIHATPATSKPDTSFLHQHYDLHKQRQFGNFILEQMGYDFDAGRLDESAHPFATGLNRGDVRITTRFLPEDLSYALFSTLHEGGHALYEQNMSPELDGTTLSTGTSMGMHEAQSRFWENTIGRSQLFWERYFPDLQSVFPDQLAHVSLDQFYRAINEAKPSLIRTESDEITYNLHIMIRYELEKDLFNGRLKVADLPMAWNEKYRDYLGVTVPNDKVGVLQDVHWSGGGFGYFPSYSLGNMYAAQIQSTLRTIMPEFDQLVVSGNLKPIKQWFTDNIYSHGKLHTPQELIQQVTGAPLTPDALVEYLETKYKQIYKL